MISGIDEAGRGPVIGPLVVAGVKAQDDKQLINMKIRDSKKTSPRRRIILAKTIKKVADTYEFLIIPAKDIDDMRKVMTLNEIEVNAFIKIIKKLKPEICYVDSADVNEKRFAKDIQAGLTFKTSIISKHKADDIYPIVSAASIIAKTIRDKEVKKIEFELQKKLNLPLGSGYPADPITKKFLIEWYKRFRKMPPYTRHSWKTVQNIKGHINTKKIDDY